MAEKPMAEKPEIGFYHLTRSALEAALPRLLERALAHGFKAVVRVTSEDRLKDLNTALWTYDPGSFLPHGGPDDGDAAMQPIYLTTGADVPNDARLLVLTEGLDAADLDRFDRAVALFDGRNEAAVTAARERWKTLKDQGYPLTYWQQAPDGRWQKKG